jgi:hypothetical protein
MKSPVRSLAHPGDAHDPRRGGWVKGGSTGRSEGPGGPIAPQRRGLWSGSSGCEVVQCGYYDVPAHLEGVAVGHVADPELDRNMDEVAVVP